MAFNDDEQDPMEREALLAQLAPKNTGMTGIGLPGGTGVPTVSGNAQEVAKTGSTPDLSSYDRRGGGTGGIMGGAIGGGVTGASLGAAGALGGALYGGIKGAITKHAKSAPTDFMEADARSAIAQQLGVDPSDPQVTSALTGQGWKPGDRYVGEAGLTSTLGNISGNQAKNNAAAATAAAAAPAPVTTSSAPAAPPTTGLGAFAGKMGGFDANKFSDPNKSEKYKIGEVMSRFDPRLGVTPEMLAALNALGIAEFSGSGDKLTLKNTKGDPRMGVGGTADVVKGLKGNNDDTAWQPWFVDDGAGDAAQGPTAGAGGGGLPNSLVSTDPEFFKKLMAQLQGSLSGPTSIDDSALRQLL